MSASDVRKRGILGTYIIGAVPSYETLDKVCNNYKRVYFFVDFNNMIKGLYYPEMLSMILNEILSNNGVFPSILINEWMYLQSYLEAYSIARHRKPVHCIYYSEGGQSYYHVNLYKNYKMRRKNALFALPPSVSNNYKSYDDINDIIRGFLVSSWRWIEALSQQSNILSLRLENLDADFIPELLLRQFNIYDDDSAFIILTSDGDCIQTLDIADNIFIIDGNNIIDDINWIYSKSYLLTEDASLSYKELTPDKIILYKALVGDSSDNIPGIKGIGSKGFFNNFIHNIPNDIRGDDVEVIRDICIKISGINKIASKIVHNIDTFDTMIKLVSFKKLIYWLQHNIQRYQQIKSIIDANNNALKEPACFNELRQRNINNQHIYQQNSQFTFD